ncbi:hypothetical protein RAS1_15190 [Phycisphaerae bacterium RAS1]|nr:hypothetical protein RAS1_15190 [Phycisphaerae bacterium RAS1]
MDEKLRGIFGDVFGLQPADFNDDLSNDDVEAWDSVMHLTLLLSLEQSFRVTFDPEEGARLTTVRAIKEALLRRGA